MKKIHILLFLLLSVASIWADNTGKPHTSFSGTITDKNNRSVIGAQIYFTELKTGAITDTAGHFAVDNLPRRSMLVQITAVGYKMITENIDLKTTPIKNYT